MVTILPRWGWPDNRHHHRSGRGCRRVQPQSFFIRLLKLHPNLDLCPPSASASRTDRIASCIRLCKPPPLPLRWRGGHFWHYSKVWPKSDGPLRYPLSSLSWSDTSRSDRLAWRSVAARTSLSWSVHCDTQTDGFKRVAGAGKLLNSSGAGRQKPILVSPAVRQTGQRIDGCYARQAGEYLLLRKGTL